jgi:hypothetical protein
MADEDSVLEEAMDNLKEAGQRIRAKLWRAVIGDILLLEGTKRKRLPSRSMRLFRTQGTVVRGTNQG